MTLVVHGISTCDTVKRARAWLGQRGVAHEFFDFKKAGLPAAKLDAWLLSVGWERLLNRQGLTWKKLDVPVRMGVTDAASARALMLASPSVIKRPVVQWAGGEVTVGFDEAQWAQKLPS